MDKIFKERGYNGQLDAVSLGNEKLRCADEFNRVSSEDIQARCLFWFYSEMAVVRSTAPRMVED